MSKRRVILWGPGGVGEYALRYVLGRPDLELVGVRCYSEDKEGRDVGEIYGNTPCGVRATRDVGALLSLGADCVIFTPRATLADHTVPGAPDRAWVEELLAILASGANVTSSTGSPIHWRHLRNGETFLGEITAACRRGRSSAFFTGIDPGFTDCVLGATVGSMVGEITQIRSWEMIDYSTYMAADTISAIGFGRRPEELSGGQESVEATWSSSLWVLADACGVEIEEIKWDADVWLSPEPYKVESGLFVDVGTVGALRWSLTGIVDGEPRIQTNHVNRLGRHAAPDWPSIGDYGGYRIEVDGFPPIRGDFPFGLPGGTGKGLDDAMAMTAARLVNSIGAVVEAPPGFLTPNDLPLIGPRYGLAR
jgi:2,4-diaminopentanoate dehydrogenase